MKLACSSKMALGDSYEKRFAYLKGLGFEGVELRIPESDATPHRIAEIEDALAKTTIGVSSVVIPTPVDMIPLGVDARRRAKIALDIGARLGGAVMTTAEHLPQSPLPLWDPPQPLSAHENEMLFAFLSEVAEYAEKVSAVAILEPINRYEGHYYNRIEEVMAACDRVGSQHVKVVIDFFHMHIEERDITESIQRAAGYIYHVQLGDSNRELPGQGHIDFRRGFAALRQIGYDRYMALECRLPRDPQREMPECIRFLRRCLKEGLHERPSPIVEQV